MERDAIDAQSCLSTLDQEIQFVHILLVVDGRVKVRVFASGSVTLHLR
jgi:hypothetical protein